jgi:hypothetical protein
MISFDSSDLEALARDLADAPAKLKSGMRQVVRKSASAVRDAARAVAPNPHHAGLYRASITLDVTESGDVVEAEVGPDKDLPQGDLGNLLEFGDARGGAQPHLVPAMEAQEPQFVSAAEAAAEAVL